jgi:hypothetical protein
VGAGVLSAVHHTWLGRQCELLASHSQSMRALQSKQSEKSGGGGLTGEIAVQAHQKFRPCKGTYRYTEQPDATAESSMPCLEDPYVSSSAAHQISWPSHLVRLLPGLHASAVMFTVTNAWRGTQ